MPRFVRPGFQNRADRPIRFGGPYYFGYGRTHRSQASLCWSAWLGQEFARPNAITNAARKISILTFERCGAHRPVVGWQFSETEWHRHDSPLKGGWHLLRRSAEFPLLHPIFPMPAGIGKLAGHVVVHLNRRTGRQRRRTESGVSSWLASLHPRSLGVMCCHVPTSTRAFVIYTSGPFVRI